LEIELVRTCEVLANFGAGQARLGKYLGAKATEPH